MDGLFHPPLEMNYELFRSRLSEPLDGGLGALVCRVEPGEGAQERRDDGDDGATIVQVLGGGLNEEEVRLEFVSTNTL